MKITFNADKAHMILLEGPKDYTCYVRVVQDMEDITMSDTYPYHSVERVFQKENGTVH